MLLLVYLYFFSGLLLIGLSLPLMARRVPPNPLYGFRVEQTLANPQVWYDVNAYAARGLLWVGVLTSVSALLLKLVPGIGTDAYAIGVTVIVLAALTANLITSFRYLKSLGP